MLISIINFFFIPILSAYIYFLRTKREFNFSAKTFACYVAFMVTNVVVARVPVVILRFIGFDVFPDSTIYTAIATFTALILPFAAEIIKKAFDIKCEVYNDDSKEEE